MSICLGIDFGTSTNVVTYWDANKKTAVPVPLGKYGMPNVFPNVIYYESATNKIVGDDAVAKGKQDPTNAVFAIKRRLESVDFKQAVPKLGLSLSSEDIATDIFGWIKKSVEEKYGGQPVDGVVISVPFAFQHRERKRIERAAQRAGLKVLGLIEEPVAAALSFGLIERATRGKNEKILVFDLGGGTFDVTIFDFQKQSDRQFAIKVITTDGATKLGGIDIDDAIVDNLLGMLDKQFPDYNLDTRDSKVQEKEAFMLRQQAIEMKEILSDDEEADLIFTSSISDEFLLDDVITRDDLIGWLRSFMTKIEDVLNSALDDADLEPKDIDRIIMVGGTSNIPAVNELVREYFGKEPEQVRQLDLMVGEGAGIYCGLKYVEKSLECNIAVGVSRDIGINRNGRFKLMLARNTLYGTPSAVEIITLNRLGQKDISVPIVQGNQTVNSKVATIDVPIDVQNKLSGNRIGVRLNTDKNSGTILYELYDVSSNGKAGALLKSDKAGEE